MGPTATDMGTQPAPPSGDFTQWMHLVPDGAISLAADEARLLLRASQRVQERFETLLAARKAGTITEDENREYEAICQLDDALSWLNRLARGMRIP